MDKEFIYVDNAATTKISNSVFKKMEPYLKNKYGNPSSIYSIAHDSAKSIQEARKLASKIIGANENEIYFTSSGTESNNWAIKCCARAKKREGKNHIITTNIEHHSVLHSLKSLEQEGFEITYLPVDNDGLINAEQVKNAIRDTTALVSIMYVNNEIGTIFPIKEIGEICKDRNIVFHTDAVQAIGYIDLNVKELNVDLLSISGHKINAPKGIGLLYIKNGVNIDNFIDGGGQERGRRGGTENIAFIVGLAQAMEDTTKDIQSKNIKLRKMRNRLIDGILYSIPKTRLNGSREKRVSSNINVSFEGIEGEGILLLLDSYKIMASSGSACTSGSLDPSHVLLALGLPPEIAHGSLRLSLSEDITENDIDYIINKIKIVVEKLRNMSPIWNN